MVIFESWPPVGGTEQRMQGANNVDKCVTHKEKEIDHGGDFIDGTEENCKLGDRGREQ